MAPSSYFPTNNSASLQPPIGTPVRGFALPVAPASHDAGLVSELWARVKTVHQADQSKSDLLDVGSALMLIMAIANPEQGDDV